MQNAENIMYQKSYFWNWLVQWNLNKWKRTRLVRDMFIRVEELVDEFEADQLVELIDVMITMDIPQIDPRMPLLLNDLILKAGEHAPEMDSIVTLRYPLPCFVKHPLPFVQTPSVWSWRERERGRERVRQHAGRTGQYFPVFPPNYPPLFPFLVPVLGSPEKAG